MFRPTPPPDSWTNHGHGFIFRHARQTNSMNRGRTMHWSARQTNLKQWCPPRPARPIHKEIWKIRLLAPSKHSNSMKVIFCPSLPAIPISRNIRFFHPAPPDQFHEKSNCPRRPARPISWKVYFTEGSKQIGFHVFGGSKRTLYRQGFEIWNRPSMTYPENDELD